MIRLAPIAPLFPYTTLFRSELPLWVMSGTLNVDPEEPALFLIVPLLVIDVVPIVPFMYIWLSAWKSRSEEHTSELQSREKIVCRLLLVIKKALLIGRPSIVR